jgi:hypothetical protein
MTGDDYRHAIDHLGMTQVGSARFFGVNDKTPRRWISGEHPIPCAVSMLLRVMVRHHLTPHHVLALEDRVASA